MMGVGNVDGDEADVNGKMVFCNKLSLMKMREFSRRQSQSYRLS